MTVLRDQHRGTGAEPGGETVGAVPWDDILAQARKLEAYGGPAVPDGASSLADLQVTGADCIFTVSCAGAAGDTPAVILASGGTTGSPKPTYVPCHQALDRLLPEWAPLRPGATLLNLFTPGRLWASHYYMQALAERSGSHVLPSGPYSPAEVGAWLPLLHRMNVTALAGTPTALADFAEGLLEAGENLAVDTIIWMAEPWTPAKEAAVRRAFPNAGLWGNYGSVETYVIGTSTPTCDLGTLHLMSDQVVEFDAAGALLSRAGDGWTVPVVRYRLGDRLAAAACRCERPRALRVEGRADDSVKLHGTLLSISEILDVVTSQAGVTGAQLVFTGAPGGQHVADRLTVRLTGDADPERICSVMMREFYSLELVVGQSPERLAVCAVGRLERIDRTNKVPAVVWRETERAG
ncbi:AMP-binding enzyme [Streptomyces sp. S4.7]|uniref:AMP-binding protein n=1 Tax=Streptomyces sp. S4.7 TaxID=2705439 RepID=UPI001398FDB1|nr:AMP-binding protein [Streptomyces sp. S4.7]QHY99218.1 AMP-binding enzyme [Streptomyces sp. S4.7]